MWSKTYVSQLHLNIEIKQDCSLKGRRDLSTVVYTFGEGAHCKIEINSATTAGAVSIFHTSLHDCMLFVNTEQIFYMQVVRQLCKGLGIIQEDNLFGLFEKCGSVEKHIEGRVVLADVLAKFER